MTDKKLSPSSITKLFGVHPKLVSLMHEAIKQSPHTFIISQGVRTAEYQNELYQQGRTKPGKIVTNADGYNRKSNHQAKSNGLGHAVDIAVIVDGKAEWNDLTKYKEVGEHICKVAQEMGISISWGGRWKKFKDYPHFELA